MKVIEIKTWMINDADDEEAGCSDGMEEVAKTFRDQPVVVAIRYAWQRLEEGYAVRLHRRQGDST